MKPWGFFFYALLVLDDIVITIILAIAGARVDGALTFARLTASDSERDAEEELCTGASEIQ